jgi:predicted O-linked N-acetylglucosamine transferase (SPINDLY family)
MRAPDQSAILKEGFSVGGKPERRYIYPMIERLLQDGLAAHRAGWIIEAETAYRTILEHKPLHFDARHLLGVALRALGRPAEAAAQISLALVIDPASADACNNLANVRSDLGDEAAMRPLLRRAVQLRPAFFQASLTLAQLALRIGDRSQASGYFTKAAGAAPAPAWHFSCLGKAARADGNLTEAARAFARAAAADPAHPGIFMEWGGALEATAQLPEAAAAYRQGLQRNPSDASFLEGIGRILRRTFILDGAAKVLRAALSLDPASYGAALHLAAVQIDLKRLDLAQRWFSVARKLNPADEVPLLGCFNTALFACDWASWKSLLTDALARMRTGRSGFQPFSLLATSDSPADQLLAARAYSTHLYGEHPQPLWQPGIAYRHDRIRIGYLSADFHTHATAYLVAELIEVHDRDRFEVIAFSYGPDDGSPMRRRLVEAFDQFHDIRSRTDREAAELIRQAEIDILIDLKGYTQDARPEILAYRPAPAQVNYLGFPGSLGSPFHDYVIADAVVAPPEDDRWYSERVIRLPGSYQVNDARRTIAPETPTRSAEGLPEDAFVFCCFNNNWKIGPAIFDIWMDLLRDRSGSVLWLIQDNDAAVANLRAAAKRRGIDPARLIFARRVPLPEHLARHRLADLFLDTLPYGAHTTASDAIYAGLPILTCRGKTFAGRVAASLLTALGVPDLIAESFDDYAAIARQLATTPGSLAEVRAKIMSAPGRETLFDARAFARGYEEALLSIR